MSPNHRCRPEFTVHENENRLRRDSGIFTIKGFTLIELLVVLVILSGTAALVAPRLASSWDHLRLRGAARGLAAALRYARTQAITTKQRVTLKLDLDKQSYQMEEDNGGKGEAGLSERGEEEVAEDQGKWRKVIFIPLGVRLKGVWDLEGTGRREAIIFYPRGSASGGRILLVSAEGKRLEVRVDPFGGRPEIISPEEEDDNVRRIAK